MNRFASIAEVAEINPTLSGPPTNDDTLCSFIPMDAVDELAADITRIVKRPFKEVAKDYTPFSENDVLFAKITPCMENGKCAIAHGLRSGVGFGSTEFHVVRASKQILPEWIYFFWRLPETRALAERNMTGTAGQKRVPTSFLENLKIPLPSVEEQRRLIVLLKEADRLRRMRRYALQICDEFMPAAFLAIFGDPIENLHAFEFVQLQDELQCIESGFSPVCDGPRESSSQWAVLGLGAVTTGVFNPEENKRLPDSVAPLPELEVQNGDLLVTRKNTYDLVAACVYVRKPPPRLLLPDTIFRFRLKKRSQLSPVFLWGLLSFPSFRRSVQRLASGSAGSMPGISKEKFMTVRCPAPPLHLQQEFSDSALRQEQLRSIHVEALRQADHLFQTLLHQAFSI